MAALDRCCSPVSLPPHGVDSENGIKVCQGMRDPVAARFGAWWLPLKATFSLFSKLGSRGDSIRERFREWQAQASTGVAIFLTAASRK